MQDIGLPFGEWLPDLGENENPGLTVAANVFARPGGYEPIEDVFAVLPLAPTASISAIGSAFAYQTAAFTYGADYGSPGKLHVSVGSLITEVAVSSTSSTTEPWQFTQFNDTIYAVNVGNAAASTASNLWKHARGASTYVSVAVSGLRGRSIARVGNFLMIAGANDTIGSSVIDDFRFRWSGFNQPDSWAVSQTTQAGTSLVRDATLGRLTGVASARTGGVLFQQYGVSRIDYVGPPKVWNETIISTGIGCISPRSIVTYNDITYFISHDGIHATDGVSVQSISEGRVNDWLRSVLRVQGALRVTAGVDWATKTIVWAFQGVGQTINPIDANIAQLHLLYNVEMNRFSVGLFTSRGAAKAISPQTDTNASTPGNLWLITDGQIGFDEELEPILGITLGGFFGETLAAEMTTGYRSLTPGRRVAINAVEPVYDGAGAKVAINAKATLAGAVTAGTPVAANSLGIANVRADGRAAAVSVTFDAAAEWSEFKGAIVTTEDSGAR